MDFPFPSPICNLHIPNHLYLHTPHQAILQICNENSLLFTSHHSGTMTEDPFHKATLLKRRLGVREDKSEYFDLRCSRKLTKSKYFWHSIQPIYIFVQGIRQRNRTNLLTAKQSLNLLLITTICGGGSTFVNVIYPAIKGQKPEIM